jgi:uncharacterized protein YqgC (DUF456 family)
MNFEAMDAWAILALILVGIGLIGAIVPVLPGPLLIWLGALLWARSNGFEQVGWPLLVPLLLLALVAMLGDYFINAYMSRRAGASWKAVFGSIAGGLAGGILLTGTVPVVGTLVGALIGSLIGTFAAEFLDKRKVSAALNAMRAYLGGWLLASLVEVAVAVTMVVLFVWQAFWS